MKTSFIATILNEQKNIEKFLKSITQQTKLPDEIIITDGGSTDETIRITEQFIQKHPFLKINLIKTTNTNRSQGRNIAIENTTHQIIAISDAGCTLHPDWLKNITLPFENPEIKIVAGIYQPITKTLWQKASATTASINFNKINPQKFLPSSRSIAFRKSAWNRAGKYPENLNTAEDLVFAQKLQQTEPLPEAKTIAFNAIVNWYPPTSTLAIIKQFYSYAHGDGIAGFNSKHAIKYFIKTFFFIILIIAIFTSPLLFIQLLTVLFLWILIQSTKRAFNDSTLNNAGFIRGLYLWCHIGWALILFPVTFLGFWSGVIQSIIKKLTSKQKA